MHDYSAHFNPYLNYHRPCAQAEIEVGEEGRQAPDMPMQAEDILLIPSSAGKVAIVVLKPSFKPQLVCRL